jgi:hypothetical protein
VCRRDCSIWEGLSNRVFLGNRHNIPDEEITDDGTVNSGDEVGLHLKGECCGPGLFHCSWRSYRFGYVKANLGDGFLVQDLE